MLAVNSIKTASPGESTTINFIIINPSGTYEFCVDSVLVQFTDNVGDIKVITPMPVYPKVCICPPAKNSSCLSYASAGKAYGQLQGYRYVSSNSYKLAFNIQIDPNPASSLTYPGVSHSYEVQYSYKFVNCKIGCWFENPQQEQYSDFMYIHGLTQNQIFNAQAGTEAEQAAANSIAEAQQDISDASNAIEQAKSTLSLVSTARCVSTSKADLHLSTANDRYSEAMVELIAAQSAYNSENYETAKSNASLSKQFAIQTKNEADMATNLIQVELQRLETVIDSLTQANLSVSYSRALQLQAETIDVRSDDANALILLALEYLNKTESACESGEYNVVVSSADIAIEKAGMAKQSLEPLVKKRLAELFGGYAENLSNVKEELGEFSSNYSNSTIEKLTSYKNSIANGTFTEYLLYIEMLPAIEEAVEKTVSASQELSNTIGRLQNVTSLGQQFRQNMNTSEVEMLIQNSVEKLSDSDFNSSLNLTQEAGLKLTLLEADLRSRIQKIEDARSSIDVAAKTITEISADRLLIFGPDMSYSETALDRARESLYSNPDKANEFARLARVLAIEQRRRMESIKLGITGAVIIIIILAVIISRVRNPSRIYKRQFKDKY